MKCLIFLYSSLVVTFCAGASELPTDVKANINERITKEVSPSVVVAIIEPSGTTFYSQGTVSKDGPKADEHHVYEIGSVTKTFTCLILADMVRKGEVKLEDPIEKYLPTGIKAPTRNGKSITLGHLATHRSSLPRWPDNIQPTDPGNPYANYDEKLLYAYINSCELTVDIGSTSEYSNLAMALLGNLLARAAGTDYESLLQKRVLDPLGLKHTSLHVNDQNRNLVAFGHARGEQVENWELNALAPAGAIKSDAVDMARYVAIQMGLVKTELADAVEASQADINQLNIGLAWFIKDNGLIFHNGSTGGYQSFVGFYRDGSKGVVVLTNSNVDVTNLGVHILDSSSPLLPVQRSLEQAMTQVLQADGIDKALAYYHDLKTNHPDEYRFDPSALNNLGYNALNSNKVQDAIKLFELNVAEHPEDANGYDSLGEAYAKAATNSYKKALVMDPANSNAAALVARLSPATPTEAAPLTEAALDAYVGTYPGPLTFTVTREGTQLMVQATGQPAIPVYPSGADQFAYKVIDAKIDFHRDSEGKVTGLVLNQKVTMQATKTNP